MDKSDLTIVLCFIGTALAIVAAVINLSLTSYHISTTGIAYIS